MEYMGDKQYWDEKFAGRGDESLAPEELLVENIGCFKAGSVLDIACGDGRNALFLAGKGFEVTGVDFSSKALARLEAFARRNNYSVMTGQVDLSIPGSLKGIGKFDNILINHYRLSKEELADLGNHITDGGILFVCGFGHKHKADSRIREQDLIQPDDFEGLSKSFELTRFIENKDDRGYFVTYIFQKKKS